MCPPFVWRYSNTSLIIYATHKICSVGNYKCTIRQAANNNHTDHSRQSSLDIFGEVDLFHQSISHVLQGSLHPLLLIFVGTLQVSVDYIVELRAVDTHELLGPQIKEQLRALPIRLDLLNRKDRLHTHLLEDAD